jgi:hypothetical protein
MAHTSLFRTFCFLLIYTAQTTFVLSALYCPKPHSSLRSALYWPIPDRTTFAHSALYCPIPHSSVRSALYCPLTQRTTYAHSALYCPIPHSSVRSALYCPLPQRTTYAHFALYCPMPHFCPFCLMLAYTAHFISFYITLCLHVARNTFFTFSIILAYIHFSVACVSQNRCYVAVPSTRPASLFQHHIP